MGEQLEGLGKKEERKLMDRVVGDEKGELEGIGEIHDDGQRLNLGW